MTQSIHKSVLLDETVSSIAINKNGVFFDGTVGFAGHSSELVNRLNADARLICSDKDMEAFRHSTNLFEGDNRVVVYNTSFINVDVLANLERVDGYDGIMADLGVSSYQFDNPEAGFTYREESVLDLRMNKNEGMPAYELLNNLPESEIARIIFEYGEERKSRQIAKKVIEFRKGKEIRMTSDLKAVINSVIPDHLLNKSLSRVFQALRIYVNNELDELKQFLEYSLDMLNPGGRLAIITFHSLEDRIVKEFFKHEATECVCPAGTPICICDKEQTVKVITRKPIVPSDEEIKENKRARSAKLRVAERV